MTSAWLSAAEIATARLPGLPATKRGVTNVAARETWDSRPREGRGGGLEYAVSSLPEVARIAYARQRLAASAEARSFTFAASKEAPKINTMPPAALSGPAIAPRRDAKLIVLTLRDEYGRAAAMPVIAGDHHFAAAYNAGEIPGCPDWVREQVPSVSAPSLARWRKARDARQFGALAGRYGNRKGTSPLDRHARAKAFVLGIVTQQPLVAIPEIHRQLRIEFGAELEMPDGELVPLPPLRTLQRAIAAWRVEHGLAIEQLTDPDGFKSRRRFALGRADAGIERLNQRWEIDASPADVLLLDGRYSLYAVVDVWSRRMMLSITKTPRAQAALLLVRRAIKCWGVPETVRTDNGSDFKARAFVGALAALNIAWDPARAYTPEQKPFVERHIGTVQRGLMARLPGFIGHDVADAQKIRARKAFAQRLSVADDQAFAVSLTCEQLQEACDRWAADEYARRPHAGLGGKLSPFGKAASWTGPVPRIEHEGALAVLCMPIAGGDGTRVVGKKGIRVDGAEFWGPGLEPGARVLVRHDPADMGKVYVFAEDGSAYITTAVNWEREGIDPVAFSALAKAEQAASIREAIAPVLAEQRDLTPAELQRRAAVRAAEEAGQVVSFPAPSTPYSTPQLDAAAVAADAAAARSTEPEPISDRVWAIMSAPPRPPVRPVTDEDEWWAWAQRTAAEVEAGVEVSAGDLERLANIRALPWYRARLQHEEFRRQFFARDDEVAG